MVVVDHEEFRRLPAVVEMYRAALAQARSDVPGSAAHARRVLDLSAADDHVPRAAASGLLGLVHWAAGDLEVAHRAWSDCVTGLRRAGFVADTFGCAIAQTGIRLAQGRLGDAKRTYEEALRYAAAQDGPVLRGTADTHVGLAPWVLPVTGLVGAPLQIASVLGTVLGINDRASVWTVIAVAPIVVWELS